MAHHAHQGGAMSFGFLSVLQNMPSKDRQRLQWAAVALGAVLLWTFNVAPALKKLREVPTQLAQLDAQTQSLKAMQAQAQALQKSPRLNHADAAALLQQSASDVLGTGARLGTEGTRVTLTLSGVSADNLAQFLALARSKSHALPVEAHLQQFTGSAANAKALWRGTLILNLPAT
jgi:general secretion pathway protein M